MKYLSLFSGIGGFELGIGDKAECIGYSEIDKYATQIYSKHFNQKNYGDITKITAKTLPDFELLVGGFPCQAFSIAGKRGGFNDTRGTLFFEIARILKAKSPRLLLLENVKGLLSHDNGRTFATIIATLDELGYDLQWQVLNSKNFGVPQNRERVFIIGHIRGTPRPKVFPFTASNSEDIVLPTVTTRVTADSNGTYVSKRPPQESKIGHTPRILEDFYPDRVRVFNESPTLRGNRSGLKVLTERRTDEAKELRRKGIVKDTRNLKKLMPREDDLANTITTMAEDKNRYLSDGIKIRRLTPKECERLQGFPDNWTEGISDTQRYKCLGNAVTVNVIKAVVEKLF